ncbi:MAG: hypothetical protein SFV23_23590 [Planctomycetaceae bacterium]|nr:hypothetical protein [Planctomycetaceae bacterium]
MNSPADGANGGMLSSGGVERSVGFLIVGIGVVLFFLLAVFGLNRVEKISTDATRLETRAQAGPASEIGGISPDEVQP